MREYTVTLDSETIPLRYTKESRKKIERQYPRPDGQPGNIGTIAKNHVLWDNVTGGSFEVQAYLLYAGVMHAGDKWTLEKVEDAFFETSKTDDGVVPILRAMTDALLESGVLGRIFKAKDSGPKETVSPEVPKA